MGWAAGLDIASLSLAGNGHCRPVHNRALPFRAFSFTADTLRVSMYRAVGHGRRSTADFPDDFEHGYRFRTDSRVDTILGGMEVADAGRRGLLAGWNVWVFDPAAGRVPVHATVARDIVRGSSDLATGIGPNRRANRRDSGSPDAFFHGECPSCHRIPAAHHPCAGGISH